MKRWCVTHWASAPPQSVVDYYRHDAANPQFALRPGEHFWRVNTPLVGRLSLATLLTSRDLGLPHRKWRMIGAGVALVVISTFAWFVPAIMKLMSGEVMRMEGGELA